MDPPKPGHYWKTPFIWEPGCPEPAPSTRLCFEPASNAQLHEGVAAVMADSLDESDRFTVATVGARQAAADLFALMESDYFVTQAGWWRLAKDDADITIGFVLPVLFKSEARVKQGQPEGTILYVGVLPGFRGRGYVGELLGEATRIFIAARCWRIFCDTGSDNFPMIRAFREAGYRERTPWQRPLA